MLGLCSSGKGTQGLFHDKLGSSFSTGADPLDLQKYQR